jgi:RNA-directed DNA polymerase
VRTCLYEQQLLDNLVDTTRALQQGNWQPAPPVVFCVPKPKMREVYAAQFQDRVVHHWLVPQLEQLLDSTFIYDAASNRKGKGTHFAVDRLQHFMRKYRGQGWLLQLDIANFFNTVDRRILLALLARHLHKAARKHRISLEHGRYLYALSRQIVNQPLAADAILLGDAALLSRVPPHKRLANAGANKGLPIGNLTSQFFANLYMNELDQFIKHQLKCRAYVRYVDDFVLLHDNKMQLINWHQQIADFLQQQLALTLKSGSILAPLSQGADFLGYIVKPGYRLVRRRVLGNLHEKLQSYAARILKPVSSGWLLDLPAQERESLRATLASYWGHFAHANSFRLRNALFKRYPWLTWLFADAQTHQPRWQPKGVTGFASQCRYFYRDYPADNLYLQKGNRLLRLQGAKNPEEYPIHWLPSLRQQSQQARQPFALITEQGFLPGGMKRRILRQLWLPGARLPAAPQPAIY